MCECIFQRGFYEIPLVITCLNGDGKEEEEEEKHIQVFACSTSKCWPTTKDVFNRIEVI